MKYTIICLLLSGCGVFSQEPDIMTVYRCPTPPSSLLEKPAPITLPNIESK